MTTVFSQLVEVNQSLLSAKADPPNSLAELESLADKSWKANALYENELARLQQEKEKLDNVMAHIWKSTDGLLSFYKVDEKLSTLFDDLVFIKQELENLSSKSSNMFNHSFLRGLQEKLHDLESSYCRNGKFFPLDWIDAELGDQQNPIPKGQGILSTLLARNYKLIRHILEREPPISYTLIPPKQRLENIIHKLQVIKESFTDRYDLDVFGSKPVDPIEIRLLQEELFEITKNSDDQNQSLDVEQKKVLTLLQDEAYNLVHECLVEHVESFGSRKSFGDLIASAVTQARYVSDSIVRKRKNTNTIRGEEIANVVVAIDSPRNLSLPAIYGLKNRLIEGVEVLKQSIKLRREQQPFIRLLGSTTTSALGYVNSLFESHEPVDPALSDIYNSLLKIRNELKDLRNQKDLSGTAGSESELKIALSEFEEKIQIIQHSLDDIDSKKFNGQFLDEAGKCPKGQATLSSVIDECYCLVAEILVQGIDDK